MIDRPDDMKLDWLCRVTADMLAPDRPDLQGLLHRILREVFCYLMELVRR